MDVRQMSAVNQWWWIWPGRRSLLGLYTRRGPTAVKRQQVDWSTTSLDTVESCRWVKTCMCYRLLPEARGWTVPYVWTFNQWETTVCFVI